MPNLEPFKNHKCPMIFDKRGPDGHRNDTDIHSVYTSARDWTGWPPSGVVVFSTHKVRSKGEVEENSKDLLSLLHVYE